MANKLDFLYHDELREILRTYKDSSAEALDGDEVDKLIRILYAKINYLEGNITEEEYENILDCQEEIVIK